MKKSNKRVGAGCNVVGGAAQGIDSRNSNSKPSPKGKLASTFSGNSMDESRSNDKAWQEGGDGYDDGLNPLFAGNSVEKPSLKK